MKFFLMIFSALRLLTSCAPNGSMTQAILDSKDASETDDKVVSMMSLREVKATCNSLADFRDRLEGIEDARVFDEIRLRAAVGGYEYGELLYIVKRYGQDVGRDNIYEKCVKYLYLYNDGEYAGAIEEVIPESKSMLEGRSQSWLLDS